MNRHKGHIRQYLAVVVALAGLMGSKAWAGDVDSKDATISVTPVPNVTMTLTGLTAWNIGTQDVGTSTVSYAATHLTNTGDVDVSATSQVVANTPTWIASLSSGTLNNYTLYVATSAATPNPDGSEFDPSTAITAAATPVALKGLSGSAAPNLASASGAVDLWFRLDMPKKVSTTAARNMTVRFTGTAAAL